MLAEIWGPLGVTGSGTDDLGGWTVPGGLAKSPEGGIMGQGGGISQFLVLNPVGGGGGGWWWWGSQPNKN